ncbi:Uncharacterised protein [Legionella quateirensis]|uniref:Uncharacterized protein n=1 Tax=Legionella quateirensis TaxID=45072 RepID=A0A378KW72_9GAMM|nr:hypothetical protein Lqua_1140 [Legionella quateirensis]STY17841.1 Uncharacterised protein [Legionella quateirensis]
MNILPLNVNACAVKEYKTYKNQSISYQVVTSQEIQARDTEADLNPAPDADDGKIPSLLRSDTLCNDTAENAKVYLFVFRMHNKNTWRIA